MPKVTIDGQEHEVATDAIQLGEGQRIVSESEIESQYIPRTMIEGDDAQYVHRQSMERRYKNYVPRDKALEDETIVAQVLKKHGEALKVENLEDAKAQWTQAEVAPLREQVETLESNLKTFESQVVGSAIDAAASKVWDDAFASAPDGRKSWARVNFENEFRYDAEHGYVVAVNAKGEPLTALKPTQRRPYMSVEERMAQLAKQDEYKPFARPEERITTGDGANPKGGQGGSGPKRSAMSDAEKAAYIVEHGHDAYRALPA